MGKERLGALTKDLVDYSVSLQGVIIKMTGSVAGRKLSKIFIRQCENW
jgi:hypothetical protein